MKMAYIKDRTGKDDFEIEACMPYIIWLLTVWLCNRRGRVGELGGHIYDSYRHDYPKPCRKFAPLFDGVKVWWDCKPWRR